MNKRLLARWLLLLFGFALFVVAALVLRKHARPSFFWFFLCIGAGMLFWAVCIRQSVVRYVCILLFSLCLALAGGELFFHLQKDRPAGENYRTYKENGKSVRWMHDNPVTGYRGKPSAEVRVTLVANSKLVYDVVYSTDEQGWRNVPQHPEATEAVVFFGCSFVFGEALNAEQTFVHKTAELLGPSYQVFNYGFSGYGPHQFLALLESGALRPLSERYDKVHVYYLSLKEHDLRAGGYSSWDVQGPWYEAEDGRAVRKGTFKDRKGLVRHACDEFFHKSSVYGLLFATARADDKALRVLHTAILRTAAARVKEQAHADFALALWPGNEITGEELAGAGIRLLYAGEALPDYEKAADRYTVQGDGHPNEHASDLLARFFARDVMSR